MKFYIDNEYNEWRDDISIAVRDGVEVTSQSCRACFYLSNKPPLT
jgi:hypothetical protein